MSRSRPRSGLIWRIMRPLNRRVVPKAAATKRMSGMILLLTTTGRKSGLPRTTPLQYEELDGVYYIGSARGQDADWFRNILAHPEVKVQIGETAWQATAEPVVDAQRITDFLELRLARHPHMIRAMLTTHGMWGRPTRTKLEKLACDLALVVLKPDTDAVL